MPAKKSKKRTPKKNHKKSKNNISKPKLLKIFLLVFLFAFISTSLSYFIMQGEKPTKNISQEPLQTKKEESLKEFQDKKLNEYYTLPQETKEAFEEYTQEFSKEHVDKPEDIKELIKETKEENNKETTSEIIENNNYIKKSLYKYDGISKPKIAIVIDDVSSSKQKRDILNIGYKVNMAFLPPTKGHPNSAKIAQDLPFSIIHFPMQASSKFKGAEIGTLEITDSYETIENRVKQLREWYPNVIYTNNHTGSVFTQNEEAMDKLFKALKKYDFIFVDSRTTAKSVAKEMAKKYNMPYIVRNTFMDNKKEYAYIQNQLKKAIKIAKKRGYAIAIGHPYPITLKVLKESKHLLEGLETIYVNELPYL